MLILGLTLISLFFLAVSLGILFNRASQSLIEVNESTIQEEFLTRMTINSEQVAEQLAQNLGLPLYNYDYGMLRLLSDVALANDDIVSVRIFDITNNFINRIEFPAEYTINVNSIDPQTLNIISTKETVFIDDQQHFVYLMPIIVNDLVIGGVEITFSRIGVQQDILLMREMADAENQQNILQFLQVALLMTLILSCIVIAASYVITGWLVRPIQKMASFAKQIGQGKDATQFEMVRDDEIGELAKSMNEMAENLKLRSHEINHLAYHDYLTDMPNRLLFTLELDKWIDNFLIKQHKFALFFLDLDGFKLINDLHGHEVGDELLVQVSERLSIVLEHDNKTNLYKRNTPYFIARLGGDEFVVLADIIDTNDASQFASTIIRDMNEPFKVRSYEMHIGVSIGISLYPDDGDNGIVLFKNADIAMYSVKGAGKADYHFYSSEMARIYQDRNQLENELRQAIKDDQLEVWYQPIFNLKTNKISGAEALVRWSHETRGFISPATFIPLAEETGQMLILGQQIIEKICEQISIWDSSIDENFHVAINISALQLRQKNLIEILLHQINKYNINLSNLHIEITETALIHDEPIIHETLTKLSDLNLPIWLDDFGTGFSSLSHLKDFPVSGVKIDRSFVSDLETDNEDKKLVMAVIELAKALNLDLVAEGIETEIQYNTLQENQCGFGQGYFMGRPVPAIDFEREHLANYKREDKYKT